ncbi:MAG: phospholipase A [Gammaproteobacteria bacterium]|nr:phospholipase A [Gammaproteobacteria bacterium]
MFNKYFLLFLSFLMTDVLAGNGEVGRNLTGYEPSYFVFANDGIDSHAEFKVSIKYPLDKDVEWLSSRIDGDNKIYFAYTGQYDFFLFSEEGQGRDSAPVVSRIQNPGVFIKHKLINFDDENNCEDSRVEFENGLESISLGWFHESNGQQIDNNITFNNTVNASDYVSRGWDYLGVDFKWREGSLLSEQGYTNIYARFRFFCNCQGFGAIKGREDDTTILGDPVSADIRDYDGFRLVVDDYVTPDVQYGLQLRSGIGAEQAFDNWSYRVELTFRTRSIPVLKHIPFIEDIPFTLFYFNGYGENISTYHIKNDYIGFGIKIW